MPIGSALLIAALGAGASAAGQASTNASNQQIAAGQEAFQASSQQQAEGWMTQMSNTAMQRRVSDLQSAGLNPVLAVGQGGASTPTAGSLPGASIAMQNPMSGMAQTGAQVGGMLQQQPLIDAQSANLSSAAGLNNALATKAAADTTFRGGVETDQANQQIAESKSRVGVNDAMVHSQQVQNQLNTAQIAFVKAQTDKIGPEIQALMASKSRDEAQAHLSNVSALVGQMDAIEKQYSMQFVVQKAAAAARFMDAQATAEGYRIPGLRNIANMEAANPGVSYVREVFGWAHVGAQVGTQR